MDGRRYEQAKAVCLFSLRVIAFYALIGSVIVIFSILGQ